ncbi:cation acetate symporter [Burkholderia cepacia]|uniref:Cation acetate symporter n=3 Tax=Burkholderia cepacia TaxID=292 RepID=A0ABM6NWI8_BURCE|nr:cation acetate symporter [Burkholderia cepacia]AIO23845.1 transporter, solute:sodium symporter family protein [Burkholderia cepacia ATCC 25416]ALK19476.1 cation/acetate symporter ActP [Burkholderia cepacia ATCC 25416]ASE96564.1 cation acetate symporter [Burkholderia cepacia]ATF79288.1 cation acetate symporter [Burkholderia cepacia]MCA8471570.1 cation acetate symporter [Burkholderia cepacia]
MRRISIALRALAVPATLVSSAAHAVSVAGPMPDKVELNPVAIGMFFAFVFATLALTRWAARRTRSTRDFYTAGGGITGLQNGLAIAGDYMSAASFLGLSGMVFMFGFDGLIYSIGFLVGWPFVMFLIAEPLRNLGKFTFVDVVAYRFAQRPIRLLTSANSLTIVVLYLVVQMVGAGKLIQLLFGLSYGTAELIVGVLMVVYVFFGGMTATTWVQVIKAVLLLCGATLLVLLALAEFGFSVDEMFRRAVAVHPGALSIMGPGKLIRDPANALSLGIALMFGTAGFPHILMRFFTVPNAKEARKSVLYATGFIGYFYLLTFVIGFSAIVLLAQHPEFFKLGADGSFNLTHDLLGGSNMVAVKLAQAVGGNWFYGFIAAVTFATILAVVAGLTLAGATTISHDLYAQMWARGKPDERLEMRISRAATIALSAVAIGLSILFEHVNVAFMVGLVAAVAASANFPVLAMSIFWRGMTTRGAVLGGGLGLVSAVTLTVLSKSVWVDVLHHAHAAVFLDNPALVSVPLAFVGIVVGSLADRGERARRERAAFAQQEFYAQTGVLAGEAVRH